MGNFVIIAIVILGMAFALHEISEAYIEKRKKNEEQSINTTRDIPINPEDEKPSHQKPFQMNTQQDTTSASDVKLLEYGRRAGLAIANQLTEDMSLQKAIASEVSMMFYVLQDAYQAAIGVQYERRKSNLNILFAVYWKSFNDAFGFSVEEAGSYFDERQKVFTTYAREKPGFSEKFLADSEKYLMELISWMISEHKPSHYVPSSISGNNVQPICIDLVLKYTVLQAIRKITGERMSDFLLLVANTTY